MKKSLYILIFILIENFNLKGQDFYNIPNTEDLSDSNTFIIIHKYLMENEEIKTLECLNIALAAYALPTLSKYPTLKATMAKQIGVLYDYKGNLDSTLHHLIISKNLFINQNNVLEESHVVNNIAIAYYLRGIYQLSVSNHLIALSLREKSGSQKHIAQSYNNLGLLYRAKKDYQNSIDAYNKSLKIKENIKDSIGQLNTLINIGACYNSWYKYDLAYIFALKAELFAKALNKQEDVLNCKVNKAGALINLNKLKEGKSIALEVLADLPKDTKVLLSLYETLSSISIFELNFSQALNYLHKGYDLAVKSNRVEQQVLYLNKMADSYSKIGNSEKALKYLQSYKNLSEQLYKDENNRQINEMIAVYDSNKKDKTIHTLNSDLKIITINEATAKRERNIFLIGMCLLTVLLGLLYKSFKVIKNKEKQLLQKNVVIQQSLSEKEVLVKEIHHRVKNNLQLVSSLLDMQVDYINDEKAVDAISESKNRVMSMSLIHQNLYQNENLNSINLKDYTVQLCESIITSFESPSKKIEREIEVAEKQIEVDFLIPLGLILNELITNAVKHALCNTISPKLGIKLFFQGDDLLLNVKDNGSGFEMDDISKNQSFGYKIIQTFLRKLKGKLEIKKNNGADILITFPQFKCNNV